MRDRREKKRKEKMSAERVTCESGSVKNGRSIVSVKKQFNSTREKEEEENLGLIENKYFK